MARKKKSAGNSEASDRVLEDLPLSEEAAFEPTPLPSLDEISEAEEAVPLLEDTPKAEASLPVIEKAEDETACEAGNESEPNDVSAPPVSSVQEAPADIPEESAKVADELIDTPVYLGAVRKKKKQKKSSLISSIVFLASIVVALVCLAIVATNLYSKYEASKLYEDNDASDIISKKSLGGLTAVQKNSNAAVIYDLTTVSNSGHVTDPNPPINDNDKTELQLEAARMSSYLRSLQEGNEDIFAYIYIENSKISYPVAAQTSGDDFYLYHEPYHKGYLAVGAVSMDYHNKRDLLKNYNTIMVAHNIDNGSMFHDLIKFRDESFFKSTDIYIYTLDGLYIYKPFCFYMVKASPTGFTKFDFYSGTTAAQWATNHQAESEVPSDHVFVSSDRYLTLYTCLNSTTTSKYKYVVHAYLAEVIK